MAPGITNDPSGLFEPKRTGIGEIDRAIEQAQAQHTKRTAAEHARAEAELPTPNRHIGGDVYVDSSLTGNA